MVIKILIALHVITGSIALISGGVAAIARKANKAHRIGGIIFVISMLITAIAAITVSLLKSNTFLLAVGIFTFYLTTSGWIWAQHFPAKQKIRYVRLVGGLGFAAAIFLVLVATLLSNQLSIILLVFAALLSVLSGKDLFKPGDLKRYVPNHAGRIGGAYISAVTAFLVVNVQFLPRLVIWLGPGLVGGLLIALAIRQYEKRRSAKPG